MVRIVGLRRHRKILGISGPRGQDYTATIDFERRLAAVQHRARAPYRRAPAQMSAGNPAAREDYPEVGYVFDWCRIADAHEGGDSSRVQAAHQPTHQVEDMPSVIDQDSTPRRRTQPPSAARAGAHTGGRHAQPVERDV